MKSRILLIGLFAFSVASAPIPAFAEAAAARLAEGIRLHNLVLAGDPAPIEATLKMLAPDGWQRPPLGLAYHGSTLTLKAQAAKKAGNLIGALSLIGDGTKEMDAAIKLAPEDLGLRILRLENSASLIEGSPVDRKKEMKTDLGILTTRQAELAHEEAAIVELDRGRLALAEHRLGDALPAWRMAIRKAPDSEAAGRARKLLARYGS